MLVFVNSICGSTEIFLTARSCTGVTVVPTVIVLSEGSGSGVFELTWALFSMAPGSPGALTVILIVFDCPDAMPSRLQVTVSPDFVQSHPLPEALMFVAPEGRVSRTTTRFAFSGPALAAVRV